MTLIFWSTSSWFLRFRFLYRHSDDCCLCVELIRVKCSALMLALLSYNDDFQAKIPLTLAMFVSVTTVRQEIINILATTFECVAPFMHLCFRWNSVVVGFTQHSRTRNSVGSTKFNSLSSCTQTNYKHNLKLGFIMSKFDSRRLTSEKFRVDIWQNVYSQKSFSLTAFDLIKDSKRSNQTERVLLCNYEVSTYYSNCRTRQCLQ